MNHQPSPTDHTFRTDFEAGRILPAQFGHREHVRLAYIYLTEAEPDAAHQRMQAALLAFLRHHAIPAEKYHETLTRAWVLAVRHFMEQSPPAASAEGFIAANPRLLDSKIMLTHYSADLLFSPEARAAFVEPDGSPIPRYAATG